MLFGVLEINRDLFFVVIVVVIVVGVVIFEEFKIKLGFKL